MYLSLSESLDRFCHHHPSFICIWGAELEFYLDTHAITPGLTAAIAQATGCDISEERGFHQFELRFPITRDVFALADHIKQAKQAIHDLALRYQITVHFSAKPYGDQPGSGLHIHLNFIDADGDYPLAKQGDSESDVMHWCIGGLLATLRDYLPAFAPHDNSYARYLSADLEAPSTISWGGNNRSVAVRIPESTHSPHTRRIEHRVAGADADPSAVFAAIICGVDYGLTHHPSPPHVKVYGNANEPQYHSPPYCLEPIVPPRTEMC